MSWWQDLFVVKNQTEHEGDDLGGGGVVDAEDQHTGAAPGGEASGPGGEDERKTGAALTEGMQKAIEEGLAAADGAAGDDVNSNKQPNAAGKGGDRAGKPQGTHPPAKRAGAEEDAGKAGEGDEKKPVKADDFQLSEQEKKTLSPKAIGRHHELHKHAKAQEAEVTRLTEINTSLAQGRDNIRKVLDDTRTTQDDLSELLNFNYMVKTGQYDAALEIIDAYRNSMLKFLGKEGAGYDPLAEHADLAQQVQAGGMSRDLAMQVVHARAIQQRSAHEQQIAAHHQRRTEVAQSEQVNAFNAIGHWNQRMASSDPDYAQKAAMLEAKLTDIISRYPPAYWPAAIEDAYNGIQMPSAQQRPQLQIPSDDGTLRPRSGVRPRAAAASSMLEAVSRGLGYQVPDQ